MSSPPVYRMKDLCIDAGRRTVMREATEVALPKLSFDLLLLLLDSAPNVVSTDQFMDTVWKGLVVSPETVGQRVKLLRDALGDDARNPTYIAGVRGLGYRLVAAVSRETLSAPPPPPAPTPAESLPTPAFLGTTPAAPEPLPPAEPPPLSHVTPSSRRTLWGVVAAFGVLVGLGVILAISMSKHRAPDHSITVIGAPYRAVVVLPFASIGADHHDDYIATGLSEMIQNRLAGLPSLRVVARTSAQAAREHNFSLQDLRDKLHAKYVVDGSLQRAGEQLRVTAQLTDAETGKQVVAVHLDRPVSAIFDLQDEIADRVATALAIRLGDTRFRPEQARNATSSAYLEYLQGRVAMGHFSVSSAKQAAEHFSKAIEIEPNFAAAYAGLALALHWQFASRTRRLQESIRARTLQLIDKALALDDSLGEAYATRAYIRSFAGDYSRESAELDAKRAIELSPSYSIGYVFYAEDLYGWDRPTEAEEMLERAKLIDPLQPRIPYVRAMHMMSTMDAAPDEQQALQAKQQAIDLMNQVIALDPQYTNALGRLGQFEGIWFGHFAEAVRQTERALQVDPQALWMRADLPIMYLGAKDPEGLRRLIASDPQGSWLARIMLALYLGDWNEAADLEFHKPDDAPDDGGAAPLLAVLLWAQHSNEYARAAAHIRERWDIKMGHEMDADNFEAGLVLSTMAQLSGDQATARSLAQQGLDMLSRPANNFDDLNTWMLPVAARACVHLLLGDNDKALEELRQASVSKSRYAFPFGWMFAINPLFDPVRNDPRFRAVVEGYERNAAAQHVLLEQMRARGEVPTRKP